MAKRSACGALLLPLLVTFHAAAEEREAVTIRGETFHVWPAENLIARGLGIREVPREKNAAWVYFEAVNSFVELPEALEDAFDYALGTAWPDDHTALGDYLKLPGNRLAIERAHKAATMDRCQMPYFGDPNNSVLGVLLPNLSYCRFLAKLLTVDGRRLEAEGSYDEAMTDYLAVMGMGEHIAQGHTLIEGLVGIAVWTAADKAVIDMVLGRPLSVKQLRTLETELNRRASRLPTAERGLHGERQFGPAIVDEFCSRPLRLFQNVTALTGASESWGFLPTDPNPSPEDGWGRLEVRIGRLVFPDRAIKRHMLGFYDQVIDRAAMGAYEAGKLGFDEEKYIKEKIPAWDVLSRLMLPSLARATLFGERSKANLAVTRAIVAIRIHTLANKDQPPQNLNELIEKVPEGALIDPFSGGLLVYQRTADGWTLYSVGANLVDDGGRQGERWDELDMVYWFPPQPIEPFDGGSLED